jgi:hypothetical protein
LYECRFVRDVWVWRVSAAIHNRRARLEARALSPLLRTTPVTLTLAPSPTQDLHGRETLAPVFDALNAYAARHR